MADIDTSQYFVVQISEYDAMKAEIERLREQIDYRDDVISMLRAEVARLGAFLHPIGEKARRG